jgi:hypothetical protein
MRYALINFKRSREWRFDPERFVGAGFGNFFNLAHAFNNSCEHAVKFGVFAFCFSLLLKGTLYLRSKKNF